MIPEKFTNRLIEETSPYLRQHAHNPVDWYPWGTEAIERARREDRPILLSIGYSACHWCHVMEHESFEDEKIAGIMNEHFVNIKVDREERPDLDEIYMMAVQSLTGGGGWPMTVFLAPDLRPFYGGTYFPPVDRHGQPGFPRVLLALAGQFRGSRDRIEEVAANLTETLKRQADLLAPQGQIGEDILEGAFGHFRRSFDLTHGGMGSAPKFPNSMALSLLLRSYRRSGNRNALEMVELTLKKMANGGIYDQLGGGFHRYSVDQRWLVPHFEKMLYDNALLVWVYLEAYQLTGDGFYRRVVEEVLGYVLREMCSERGGFFSTQDADSEGEEGKYFVWDPEEVEKILGEEEAPLFMRYFDVTAEGNFEHGKSILHVDNEIPVLSRFLDVEEEELSRAVEEGKSKLLGARRQRVPPARDDKILLAWNGMMISAFARAYQVLGVDSYLQAGESAATFVLENMVENDSLLHVCKDGKARLPAYQDDYACIINGLIDLYEASFELGWLRAAREWNQVMVERFWDRKKGGFFYTEEGAGDLILRTKNPLDSATPSGNSMGVLALLRISALTGDSSLREMAERTLILYGNLMRRSPSSCAQMLCALDFYQEPVHEVAVVGPRRDWAPFLHALHARFLPNKVLVGGDPSACPVDLVDHLPLLKGKVEAEAGQARVYVCRNSVCDQPVTTVEGLLGLLMVE